MSAFQFTLPAPSLKVSDMATYQAALKAWKDTVSEMVSLYPGLLQGLPLPAPGLPLPASLALARPLPGTVADKGPWEAQALEKLRAQDLLAGKAPRKSIRFTLRVQEAYDSKEAYCQAIAEGKEKPEGEAEGEAVELPPVVTAEEVDGLH